jgi:hypothetical protein
MTMSLSRESILGTAMTNLPMLQTLRRVVALAPAGSAKNLLGAIRRRRPGVLEANNANPYARVSLQAARKL